MFGAVNSPGRNTLHPGEPQTPFFPSQIFRSRINYKGERRRCSATVSRKIRMLRAHGLIQKVPKTHRYQVSPAGRLAISAVLTMSEASLSLLNRTAA